MQANKLTCVVAARGQDDVAASEVAHALTGIADICVQTMAWEPAASPQCEILVPLVDAGNCAHVADAIARQHSAHPGSAVMPVGVGLAPEQIASLLLAGAADFATLPLDAAAFLVRAQRVLGLMRDAGRDVRAMLSPKLKDLVGSSPAFMKPLSMLPTIAGYDAGVLILGETGTGKEVYARAIHYTSARAARPLVALNCGAVPTDLLESELFGHVRGAFTHAHTARPGLVREAECGTLFLDEIDSLPMAAQSKLLRFLQEMEYRPVGGDKVYRADVRIIAASNQDLAGMAERGSFRRDLYFRLGVLAVTLPPLRERREDIRPLAQHFVEHFCGRAGRARLALPPQTIKCLLAYHWPGNVRELRHTIERAVLMCSAGALQPEDLHLPTPAGQAPPDESLNAAKARMIAAFETEYIQRLLSNHDGNITRAANAAGKNRRAFFELMRKYAICAH